MKLFSDKRRITDDIIDYKRSIVLNRRLIVNFLIDYHFHFVIAHNRLFHNVLRAHLNSRFFGMNHNCLVNI